MSKKLILLMLCIPIIIMVGLFTTTKTVSMAIDVAVNGIEISSDKFVYLDLDDREHKEQISYTIYPTNAKNKNVSFDVTQYSENSPKAELEITEDGYINPKTPGKSRVTITTADGGYNASLVVEVVASGLIDIKATSETDTLYVGEETKINVVFEPDTVNDKVLTYSSSNPNVCMVVGNRLRAIAKGEAIITVASESHPEINDEFKITVLNKDILNIYTNNISLTSNTGEFIVSVNDIDILNPNYEIRALAYDSDGKVTNNINVITYINNDNNIVVNFTNLISDFNTYKIIVGVYENDLLISNEVSCNIKFSNEFNISIDDDFISIKTNERVEVTYYFDILDLSNIEIKVEAVDDNYVDVSLQTNNKISVLGKKTGSTKIKIIATLGSVTKSVDITVLVLPRSVNFVNEVANLDLGNVLTMAGDISHDLELISSDEINNTLLDYLAIEEDSNKLDLNLNVKDGKLYLTINRFNNLNQIVKLNLYYKDNAEKILLATTEIRFIDGVTVNNYNELMAATRNQNVVVLENDIIDFPKCSEIDDLDSVSTKLKSTYDITYYQNLGLESEAYVRVLVEFKNDIYGNGYEINANNLTNGIEATGQNVDGIFSRQGGPLHFVSASESTSSMASVKGQDNICFAVYENVNINNVTLKGMNDVEDLTDLNYAGTTVEVLGDNVNINQTRIMNGRTVLRVFGDAIDPNKKINVTISNSYLANAREFIIRAGSNKFIIGTKDNISPYINNEVLNLMQVKTDYLLNSNNINKAEYDSKYINTCLILSNVALEKSGIFSIGLDSHFAGPLLYDASVVDQFGSLMQLLNGWYNLAKTSYGVKLTLDKIVRIYDWKDLNTVDSSTLIEVNDKFEYAESLKFDVKALVEAISTTPGYTNIVVNDNGTKYVHGGIAYFGGGRNYDVVELTDSYNNSLNFDYNNYQISLSQTEAAVLAMAAGEEPFYFLLCDASTKNFTPLIQKEMIDSGEAYKFLME